MTLELPAAFLLGLLGSLHCAGMCGPIAIALAGGREARRQFVIGRCAYNAGRVLTYGLLGLPVGAFGHLLHLAGMQQALSVASGLVILGGALVYAGAPRWWHPAGNGFAWFGLLQRAWMRLFPQKTVGALLGIGLLNGLLPCGLVYAALAGAAATGTAIGASLFMLVFGLGTFPMMLALGLAGRGLQAGLRQHLRLIVPASLVLLAMLLIVRGLGLGIPYLSPALLTNGSPDSCCAPPR